MTQSLHGYLDTRNSVAFINANGLYAICGANFIMLWRVTVLHHHAKERAVEEAIINAVAMLAGASAMAVTGVPALFRALKNWKTDPKAHQLEVRVDHTTYVIDTQKIDREDPAKIQQVIEAVRQVNRITA